MDFEGALRARLIGDAAIAALVDDRVSWDERPQGDALPAITMTIINASRAQHMKATETVQRALVQVDIWALRSVERQQLRDAVAEALEPAATVGGVRFQRGFLESSRGGGESGGSAGSGGSALGFVFRQRMDFRFTFSAA